MEEPSVLDYVKSKLTFWKRSTIEIPRAEEDQVEAPGDVVEKDGLTQFENQSLNMEGAPKKQRISDLSTGHVPLTGILLVASGLFVSFFAQSLLEPPNRAWQVSMIFYALAAGLIGAAYFRKRLVPADIPAYEFSSPGQSFRFLYLVIGLVLMLLAFLFFGRGSRDVPRFNFINTLLWVLSIGYLVWAFWQTDDRPKTPIWQMLRGWWAKISGLRIAVSAWGILLIVVVGLVVFFRVYRLDAVPAEMFSDHAEKLLDVNDVLHGDFKVFFPRNTGREAFQFYWTALMAIIFNVGVSFMALKIGTVVAGLITLIYMYRLGNEIGNRWVALFALLFTGFSYWANVQSRIGLRFPLYPFFLAPVLFHLIRGLRRGKRNDFIWAGLWLGAGLHGYTAFRVVPLLVVAGILLYILHHRPAEKRAYGLWGLLLIGLISLAVFLPLLRFTFDNPDMVMYRSETRLGSLERPLPGPAIEIFGQNTWNALVMFFWDDGDVWVHSVVHRPALDVISASLFFVGLALVILRYIRRRNWVDLFLLISIPILLLPSILSLAFPNENPNLNRTAGAYIPAFLILAIGFEAMLTAIRRNLSGRVGVLAAWGLGTVLVVSSAANNYDLLFHQYDESFRSSSWNSSEMGEVIRRFDGTFGRAEDAWVVAYPYWVDTRLVGINAGYPTRDTAIGPDQLEDTLSSTRSKLFILNPQDLPALGRLQGLYPDGRYWQYPSRTPFKEFLIYEVLPREDMLPLHPPPSQ